MGELKAYSFPEEQGLARKSLPQEPLADRARSEAEVPTFLSEGHCRCSPRSHRATLYQGSWQHHPETGFHPRRCGRSRMGRPEGAAAAIRPSSPVVHGVQCHRGSPCSQAVHLTRRAAEDRRPRGHGGAVRAARRGGLGSVRSRAASEPPTHRNAVTVMHGGSPASRRAQELRNK